MPTDRNDLETRLAATTEHDTVRGLAFNAAFDAVEEHLGRDAAIALDPARKAHRPDFFSFPVSDYLRLAFDAADRLEPRVGGVDAAFHAIGYRAASNTFGSMLGATLLALSGKGDARTLLANAAAGYKATMSYGQRKLEWLAPTHAQFTFTRHFLLPAFHCGVFQAGVEATGAKGLRVEGRQLAPLDAMYEIRWTA